MGFLTTIIAGFVGAAIYSAFKDDTPSHTTNNYTITYKSSNNDMDRVSKFLRSYNSLQSLCTEVFGKDQYNSIKKLAQAVKFNTSRDDSIAKDIVDNLYKIVELRNNHLGHSSFGIGAIPVNKYVEFMDKMYDHLDNNRTQYRMGYQKFLNYKQRQLTYKNY